MVLFQNLTENNPRMSIQSEGFSPNRGSEELLFYHKRLRAIPNPFGGRSHGHIGGQQSKCMIQASAAVKDSHSFTAFVVISEGQLTPRNSIGKGVRALAKGAMAILHSVRENEFIPNEHFK